MMDEVIVGIVVICSICLIRAIKRQFPIAMSGGNGFFLVVFIFILCPMGAGLIENGIDYHFLKGFAITMSLFLLWFTRLLWNQRKQRLKGEESFKSGNYEKAIRFYEAALCHAETADAYDKYGLEQLRKGNHIGAIKCFGKAVEVVPSGIKPPLACIYKKHLQQAEAEWEAELEDWRRKEETKRRKEKIQRRKEEIQRKEEEERRQREEEEKRIKEARERGIYKRFLSTGGEVDITNPEEQVRQKYIKKLVEDYGYDIEDIQIEVPIQIGSDNRRCDIAIYDDGRIVGIVEAKSWNTKINEGHKGQLESYMSATPTCKWGVLTNGGEEICGHRNFQTGEISFGEKVPQYQEKSPTRPVSDTGKGEVKCGPW